MSTDLPRRIAAVFFVTGGSDQFSVRERRRRHVLCVFSPRPKFCITRHAMINVAIRSTIASNAERDFELERSAHKEEKRTEGCQCPPDVVITLCGVVFVSQYFDELQSGKQKYRVEIAEPHLVHEVDQRCYATSHEGGHHPFVLIPCGKMSFDQD